MEEIIEVKEKTIQSNEKTNALLIHLSALANYLVPIPLGSILLPLILWQTTKKESEYTNHHGKEAVNFNISFLLYNILTIVLLVGSVLGTIFTGIRAGESEASGDIIAVLFSTGGFITAIVALSIIGIIKLILVIIASIKANEGKLYKYPLTIRFIK